MSAAPDAVATRVLHPFTIVAAFVVCAVSFAPAYGLYRFHDDWRFVDFAAKAVATGSVDRLILRPLEQHWSPLWHSLEVANFLIAGWEADWLIRTINLLATFGSMLVLSWLLRSAGLSNLAVGGAIGVMAFHHLSATARYSFDT